MILKIVILSAAKNLSRMRVLNSDIRQRFLVALLLGMTIVSPVYALDSTPSADIKSKLEELKKEIASKAANLKAELKPKLENKAYVGNIKTHSQTSLTLASSKGPKLVTINQDTISPKKLVSEDYIAALGDIDETQVLIAKKIILLNPKPKTLHPKTYIWGKVVSVDGKLANLLDRNQKNTAISNSSDAALKSGDFIIATGEKNENDIFEAEFVHVIPQGGFLKPARNASHSDAGGPKKVATPSATLKPQTATKSASPSSSKK